MKFRSFASYPVTAFLVCVISVLWAIFIFVSKIDEETEAAVKRLASYEREVDFTLLEKGLKALESKSALLGIKPVSREEAGDRIIKYADDLLLRFGAKAETDRPEDSGEALSLKLDFVAHFASPQEFINVFSKLSASDSPIVKINRLEIREERSGPYNVIVNAELIQPYGGGNGQ